MIIQKKSHLLSFLSCTLEWRLIFSSPSQVALGKECFKKVVL